MSFQVREKVTLLPAVPTVQNGSNTAHTLRTVRDTGGRVTEVRVYHHIPTGGEGSSTDHYDKSTWRDRQIL